MKSMKLIAALPVLAIAAGQYSTLVWNFPPSLIDSQAAISFNVRAIRAVDYSPTNSWTNWIIATNTVLRSAHVPWGEGTYLMVTASNSVTGVESAVDGLGPLYRRIE